MTLWLERFAGKRGSRFGRGWLKTTELKASAGRLLYVHGQAKSLPSEHPPGEFGLTSTLDEGRLRWEGVRSKSCLLRLSRVQRPRIMKLLSVIILAVSLCGVFSSAQSQEKPGNTSASSFSGAPRAGDLLAPATKAGFSLLDPSRFHISHSYSMSYYSGGGQSGSVGLYMSTLEYQLSRPLSLRVGLGYLHQPLGFLKSNTSTAGNAFLPNFRLDFRPSESFHFMVDYMTIPSSAYGNSNGWGGYAPGYGVYNRLWGW